MSRYLKWVFQPVVLIITAIVLVVAAIVVVRPINPGMVRPQPQPLRDNEHEIVWLYPATSTTQWERLARAVQQATERLQQSFPSLEWEHNAGSEEARRGLGVPEIALSWPATENPSLPSKRLVFRWYKLASQWTPAAWVEALMARERPPLAIIGGNNSYWARELALALKSATGDVPPANRPLLLLTTATADHVSLPGKSGDTGLATSADRTTLNEFDEPGVRLTDIYVDRTFRFCFTNRQMATAVTRFIWSQLDLRPDGDPAFLVKWTDDAYSRDLFNGYMRVLRHRGADNVFQQWGWISGGLALGLPPAALAGWFTSGFRHDAAGQWAVDSSVGTFSTPNPYEAKVVMDLLRSMQPVSPRKASASAFVTPMSVGVDPTALGSREEAPYVPRRPLLVITGQSQPSRRFLRDLARSAPDTSRRFVVAMGDALSFNVIYRDREVTWPIQDLPFTLVFFCHRNPIDAKAGFHHSVRGGQGEYLADRRRASGTEDVMLYRDIVEALALAFRGESEIHDSAESLGIGLRRIKQHEDHLGMEPAGQLLFDEDGQRSGGTGEHIVCLRPQFQADRVLPRATIEIWKRTSSRAWKRIADPLRVSYDEFEVHHGHRFRED